MPLPSLRGHKEAQASAPQAPESLLPDNTNTPLEFRVLLSACRIFLGTEEPTKLQELLQQGPVWDRLLMLAIRHGRDRSDALALAKALMTQKDFKPQSRQ